MKLKRVHCQKVPHSSHFVNVLAPEYFYNYFALGVSLLFSPSQNHTLQKILLHANLPQSHDFHRFNRVRWIFNPAARRNDSTNETLTSECNFDVIKTTLERISGPAGKPMIVNRGSQGSPSSSVELVSDDILTASPFGCTGNTPQTPLTQNYTVLSAKG